MQLGNSRCTIMINARQELLDMVSKEDILCARVQYCDDFMNKEKYRVFSMRVGDNPDSFLDSLNFEYDEGYGWQEIFGTVWLKNGNWLMRSEYDGSEWWEHREIPEIPESLTNEI